LAQNLPAVEEVVAAKSALTFGPKPRCSHHPNPSIVSVVVPSAVGQLTSNPGSKTVPLKSRSGKWLVASRRRQTVLT
jgi:hypothetical protein